jgi:hypothetical protein
MDLVQQLRDGLAFSQVPTLWREVRMSEEINGEVMSVVQRSAWLQIGGYVAAADGLSAEEVQGLADSAAGPDFELAKCVEAIEAGGASTSLPAAAVAEVVTSDPFIKVQLLLEVYGAVASDGISAPEWTRLNEAAAGILGASKADPFTRLCKLEMEASELRTALIFDD